MERHRSFWETITDAADLKAEPRPNLPLVEMVGESRVLIENHMGVIAYGLEEIRVKVKFGQIIVCGCDMTISRMTKEQLLITGSIESVRLCRRGM